uniref:hypothetical protein n=1 Tax=Paractinoplanes polyasparticus TaxID=2856853 RepID=UPI001C861437|nr:hypothetical protein [Actinoplanes polyasparticus]
MSDIRTQRFTVEVSASIMPPLTEQEVHDVIARLAFEKESKRGMGALGVHVTETTAAGVDYEREWAW